MNDWVLLVCIRRMILFEYETIAIVTADEVEAFGNRVARTNEIETQTVKIS